MTFSILYTINKVTNDLSSLAKYLRNRKKTRTRSICMQVAQILLGNQSQQLVKHTRNSMTYDKYIETHVSKEHLDKY
jgi:hypothetical protein